VGKTSKGGALLASEKWQVTAENQLSLQQYGPAKMRLYGPAKYGLYGLLLGPSSAQKFGQQCPLISASAADVIRPDLALWFSVVRPLVRPDFLAEISLLYGLFFLKIWPSISAPLQLYSCPIPQPTIASA
jgi:hypothetical protein